MKDSIKRGIIVINLGLITLLNAESLTFTEFKDQLDKDSNGVYIVEGDLPIYGEDKLREYYNNIVVPTSNGDLIINTNNGIDDKWNSTQKRNITYCVNSNSFGGEYSNVVQSMREATQEWEKETDIKFVHLVAEDESCTNANSAVIFDVNPAPSSVRYLARAFFPSYPRNIRNVLIHSSAMHPTTADLTLTGILRHELGHVLGFRHEHTRPEAHAPNCVESNNWRVVTDYDSNSVMHYPQCNGTGGWALNLTEFDHNGAKVIYGTTKVDGTFEAMRGTIRSFSYNQGWRVEKHPRHIVDINGDGDADIVGFANAGVYTALSNGNGTFQSMKATIRSFSYNQGWRVEKHPRHLVDINGDDDADIVGFANAGVYTALSNGDGTFQPMKATIRSFSYNQGWRVEKHPRYLVDINGDGNADIVGFANAGVYTALSNGDGTFQAMRATTRNFSYNQGWRVEKHPRYLVDINGDGNPDIIGFGNARVYTALNNGDGTFEEIKATIQDFSYNQSWRINKHPRHLVDINGDGNADIVGFANAGVYTAVSNGDGTFQPMRGTIRSFSFNQGWRVEKHPRHLVDINGDGKADIVGFANAGVYTAVSQ